MALREFTDSDGFHWTAWDVYPSRNYDNLLLGQRDSSPDDAPGWVAFECRSTGERRRLAPVPRNWSSCSDAELIGLWSRAARLPTQRKRLVE